MAGAGIAKLLFRVGVIVLFEERPSQLEPDPHRRGFVHQDAVQPPDRALIVFSLPVEQSEQELDLAVVLISLLELEQDRASLATARAQLQKDQASLAYAEVTARRQADLLAKEATSQDSHDIAVNSLRQAQAQIALDQAAIQQRQAQLDAAEINLGYTSIVAPVDGIVVSRNVTIGQTVAASFQTPTLFLIATDLATMQVDTNVSESDIGGIRTGNKARFTVDAFPTRIFEGKVIQVRQAPQTVQNVVTYDVVVQVGNQEQLLKPGMTATMRIVTDRRDHVLRVPNQALRYSPGGPGGTRGQSQPGSQVWLLENGRPKAVPVRTGLDDDNYTEITGGLSEGAAVIVSEQGRVGAGPAASPALRFP